jgi:iron transport multicopper oxidase
MGLSATLIEAPEKLHDYPIPQDMIDSCKAQGIPVAGNAAGNIEDPYDDTGFNTIPTSTYWGPVWPVPQESLNRRVVRKPSGQISPGRPFNNIPHHDSRKTW